MTIQHRAITASSSGLTPRAPSSTGVVSGDTVTLCLVTANSVASGAVTAPSGFTLIPGASIVGTPSIHLYNKVAGGSEPASYSIAWTGGGNGIAFTEFSYSDIGGSVNIDDVQIQSNASSTDRVWPSVTTTKPLDLLLCWGAISPSQTSTPDSQMTERQDSSTTPRGYLMTQTLTSVGTTGTRTATGTAAASYCISLAYYELPASGGWGYIATPAADATMVATGDLWQGVQYRGNTTSSAVNSTTQVFDNPTGTVENDMIVLEINVGNTNAPSIVPSGWTLLLDQTAFSRRHLIYYKLCGASEPSTWTFTWAASGIKSGIVFSCYSLTGLPLTINVSAQDVQTVSNTDRVFPSVTTTVPDTMLLYFLLLGLVTASTPPDGTIEMVESGAVIRLYAMMEHRAAAGATGTRTATGISSTNMTATVAIGESSPVAGSLSVTLEDATLAATGKLAITGSLNKTLEDAALSSTGKLAITGSLNKTLEDATLVATGQLPITGTLNVTLEDATLVATGKLLLGGTLNVTLEDATLSAIGKLAITGQLNVTLEDATLVATGELEKTLGVTEILSLAEIEGSGLDSTESFALVELGAVGVYTTEIITLVELGSVGIYATEEFCLVEFELIPEEDVATHVISNAGTRAIHSTLPDEVVGYAFDPQFSWWSTIIPEESTNLLLNPSFEKWNGIGNATEYDSSGGLSAFSYVEFPDVGATQGRRCAKLTTGASTGWIYYQETLHITPGPYTFSVDFYTTRTPFTLVLLAVDTGDFSTLGKSTFTIRRTGWYRYSTSFVHAGSTDVELRLILLNTNPSGIVTYTDAWQFEAKPYATTYLDGDMISTNDVRPFDSYFWHGSPHASPSTRRAYANTGGRPVSWNDLVGFMTTNLIGLDMSPIALRLQQMSDGTEIHNGVDHLPRDFSITGRIYGENYLQLKRKHNNLVDLLKPNKALGQPQTILRYQRTDANGMFVGPPMDIVCGYQEGLAGSINGFYQETLPLKFHASDPAWRDSIENSAELQLSQTLTANGILYRDEDGAFSNLGTGDSDAFARKVGFMRDGSPVAVGPFSQFAGDTVDKIAKWDGTQWINVGTYPGGVILDLDTGYTTGYRLVVSTADAVYEYDDVLDSWASLGGFDNDVTVIRRDSDGNLWAGGSFVQDDPPTLTFNGIAKWEYDTEDWVVLQEGLLRDVLGSDAPGVVNSILPTNDGSVYVGGDFYKAEESALSTTLLSTCTIRWDDNLGEWKSMNPGLDEPPLALVQGRDGFIYAVGHFTVNTAGIYSVDMRGFARWTGFQWEEPFPLLAVDGTVGASGVAIDEAGVFWFFKQVLDGDDMFDVSPYLGPVEFFGWKDGVFYPPFAYQTYGMWDMAFGPGNRQIISILRFADSLDPIVTGTLTAPALNTIEYGGSTDAPLVVHLEGSLTPRFIDNLTLKGGAYFRYNLTLGEEEHMTIRTDSQRTMAYSNSRSNMQKFIVAGLSHILSLNLLPGTNKISVYCLDPGENAIGWLTWKNRFWGNDGMI